MTLDDFKDYVIELKNNPDWEIRIDLKQVRFYKPDPEIKNPYPHCPLSAVLDEEFDVMAYNGQLGIIGRMLDMDDATMGIIVNGADSNLEELDVDESIEFRKWLFAEFNLNKEYL